MKILLFVLFITNTSFAQDLIEKEESSQIELILSKCDPTHMNTTKKENSLIINCSMNIILKYVTNPFQNQKINRNDQDFSAEISIKGKKFPLTPNQKDLLYSKMNALFEKKSAVENAERVQKEKALAKQESEMRKSLIKQHFGI